MSDRTYGIVLVAIATVLWSMAGLFTRMLDLDVWTILGWRSLFGAATLGLIILWQRRRAAGRGRAVFGGVGWLAAAMSALSMVTYIGALKLTTVANVLALYATVPFVAAGIGFLWLREVPSRRVLIASGIALLGVMVVVGFASRPDDLAGSALAFLMTVSFSVILVMARRYPALGLAEVNAVGASACVLLCLPLMAPAIPPWPQMAVLAIFGLTTTGLAYLLFLTGGRRIPSGEAGLICLLDVVMGPLWVWLLVSEDPGLPTIVGGGIILASVFWYLWSGRNGTERLAVP